MAPVFKDYIRLLLHVPREILAIFIYLIVRKIKFPGFKASLERWIEPNIRLHTANSAKEAISSADIIITATTSYQPVLPDDPALLKEKLIIGIGSFQPTMREFPNTVYKLANSIYVDTEHAIEESGDIAIPIKEGWIKKEDVQTMSSWLTSQSSIDEKTILRFCLNPLEWLCLTWSQQTSSMKKHGKKELEYS